jgi:[acyl-carrier-protein] S-malonyltransferase
MKVGLLFPGYGSQFVGMGKELYDESRIMQEYFEEAANCLDINFVKLCFASSDAELARMDNAYTALFLVSSSISALIKQEIGIEPYRVAGYNAGEYGAIHTAGCFSFPDGLYLISKYYSFYQELLATGDFSGIKIVGLSGKQVKSLCQQVSTEVATASIAIYDAPDQHVVMGHTQAIIALREALMDMEGVKVSDVPVEQGLHSDLMDPVAVNLKLYLEKVDFKPLTTPLITNADAKVVTEGNAMKKALIKQIHSPVLWFKSMALFEECDVIVEVGPGTMLCSMMQAQYPDKKCIAINKKSDIDELRVILGKQDIITTEI